MVSMTTDVDYSVFFTILYLLENQKAKRTYFIKKNIKINDDRNCIVM